MQDFRAGESDKSLTIEYVKENGQLRKRFIFKIFSAEILTAFTVMALSLVKEVIEVGSLRGIERILSLSTAALVVIAVLLGLFTSFLKRQPSKLGSLKNMVTTAFLSSLEAELSKSTPGKASSRA